MSTERRRLHAEAMAAFAAARHSFQWVSHAGTPEWDRWRELCGKAMAANDAYIQALSSTAHKILDPFD
jgi:hypothetical protein